MGTPKVPEKALLFIATLYAKEDHFIEARQSLEQAFGEMVMESPAVQWDFSNVYHNEIGQPLYRKFIFFKTLIEKDSLSSIKLTTNGIEKKLSTGGKRNINLDPGYLTLAKIVLASTKNYSHRIYLRDGIYAEITLVYDRKKRRFVPHINTYKDYQDERFLRVFLIARRLLTLLQNQQMEKTA